MGDFANAVGTWAKATEERLLDTTRQAFRTLVMNITKDIPIATGYARASRQFSTSGVPPVDPTSFGKKGQQYAVSDGDLDAALEGLQMGGTIYVGWTAAYMPLLEYGHSKQAPQGFIRINQEQWPQILAAAEVEAGEFN